MKVAQTHEYSHTNSQRPTRVWPVEEAGPTPERSRERSSASALADRELTRSERKPEGIAFNVSPLPSGGGVYIPHPSRWRSCLELIRPALTDDRPKTLRYNGSAEPVQVDSIGTSTKTARGSHIDQLA